MQSGTKFRIQTASGRPNPIRRWGGQRATSLIEVMVVLVVLLLGIVLALRVFPTGFGIMRSNGNRSLANRLAEQQMSRLRADAANLPQGVLFAYPDANNQLQVVTRVDPDQLLTYNPTTEGNEDPSDDQDIDYNPYFADINRFRYIKGEAVKVPLPTATIYGSGGVYTCQFGPILMNQMVGDPSRAPQNATERAMFDSYLKVSGAPLTGTAINSSGPGDRAPGGFLRSQQTYVIDYGEEESEPAMVAFAPRTPNPARTNTTRTFSVTITFNNNGVLSTVTIPMTVDDSQAGYWIPIPGVSDAVPGSETITREFDRIPANAPWDTTDPYQYQLRSSNIAVGGQTTTFANIGVLNFNPSGGNYSEDTTNGTRPFTAYLDYAVLDWHILRDDREVPSVYTGPGGTVPLRLTVPSIKFIGDTELDGTFYGGLYGETGALNPPAIQVFNLNDPNGAELTQGSYRDANGAVNPNPVDADYYVDNDEKGGSYRTGTIYINANRVAAGSKLRILYKAVGDWGVSFQKAYSRYQVAVDPAGGRSPLPQRGRWDAFGVAGTPTTAQLRFPLSDLNKAFVVGISYTLQDGTVKRIPSIQMTANAVDTDPNANTAIYDDKFAVVDVFNNLPANIQAEFTNPQNPAVAWGLSGTVTGVSVKTRVIWRDTDSGAARWRVQDMDSYLTPKTQ